MDILINTSSPYSVGGEIFLSFSEFFKELRTKIGSPEAKNSVMNNLDKNQKLHILIADDDPDDQELLAEAITEFSENIKVSLARNGKDLMHRLTNEIHPDIIFLDLNMPAMNGFECLKKIKSHPDLKMLPVLIYSTSAHADQVEQTYQEGASFYIQKPCSFFDIKDLISKILAHKVEEFFTQQPRGKFLVKC